MTPFRTFVLSACIPIIMIAFAACQPEGHATDPSRATISAEALHEKLASPAAKPLVVDVREPHEYRAGHIEGSQLAPLATVETALAGVDRNREIVLVCRSGNRSGQAQRRLARRGFTNLRNMEGGMLDWEDQGLPVVRP